MKVELRQLIELTKSDITVLELSLKKLKDKQVSIAIHGLESFIESKKILLKELENQE